jgi:hypothetical protein
MKVALLVLGYREPECLRHALPIYLAAGFDVYLHVDKKADAEDYLMRLEEQASSVNLVANRFAIFWGGFSMIRAELALVNAARDSAVCYDRYLLISDDTFPLRNPDGLRMAVGEPLDRIMIRKLSRTEVFFQRYEKFYFFDDAATSLHGRPIEMSNISQPLLERMNEVSELMAIGKKQIDIYYGSQWWCLTAETLDIITSKLESDYLLFKSFEYAAVPDEICIQSIVANFSDMERVRSGPVFSDWSKSPRPFVFSNITQLTPDTRQNFLFFRKVSSTNLPFLLDLRRAFLP